MRTLLLGLLSCLIASTVHAAAYYYVAPFAASGAPCTINAPCSLLEAQTKVRSDIAGGMTEDAIVRLRAGTYTLTGTLTFGASDSGRDGYYVIWTSYPKEDVILTGATQVTGWGPDPLNANVFRSNVGAGAAFRQLYVNGVHAQRARGALNPAGWSRTATGYTAPSAAMADWGDPANIEIVSLGNWSMDRCHVASIAGATVTMATTCFTAQSTILAGYSIRATPSWVENAYELMASGYWYLDKTAGYVYYWPPGGTMNGLTVTVPTTAVPLVVIDAASYMRFSDVEIAGGNWTEPDSDEGYIGVQTGDRFAHVGAVFPDSIIRTQPGAVSITASNHIYLTHIKLSNHGTRALYIGGGCSVVEARGLWFYENASGAMQLGTGFGCPATRDTEIAVMDNYIDATTSFDYIDASGIYAPCIASSSMERNYIAGSGWAAIAVGFYADDQAYAVANTVARNYVVDSCQQFVDCGSIYTRDQQSVMGGWATGLFIQDNFIKGSGFGIGAIYLDQFTQWVTATGNVMQGVNEWLHISSYVADYVTANTTWATTTNYNPGVGTHLDITQAVQIDATPQPYLTSAGRITCSTGVGIGTVPGPAVRGGPPTLVRKTWRSRKLKWSSWSPKSTSVYPVTPVCADIIDAYNAL